MQNRAFHPRHKLYCSRVANIQNQAVDDVVAQVAVCHLPAAESQARFHLVSALQELDRLVLFGLVVVLIHRDRELDFLDGDDLLLLAGGALALFLLVEIAAIVLDAADRRNCSRRNLYQIKPSLAGDPQSFKRRKDPKLFTVFVDDPNFAGANTVVDANKGLCRTFVECDDAPPKVARFTARRNDSSQLAGTNAP